MPPAPDIRQKAIALIDQLPQDKLMAVVQLLEFLAEPPQQSTVSTQEAQLLEVIDNHLPEDEQARLDTLRDRCEWDELSEAEHQELIGYEDLLEQQRVKRLEALIELAKLRNIDLMRLNQQVQSKSQPSHAV
ncbi:MAG: hypothetical protein KME25_28380 [Symplocastrum torsivum CPER-KK1]|jgi:hypothetical protein|uniref:STAS/SEC14 domain-containing protein n=1 Tax=Symplocastrum torsivum CPER-KK1 TaxID=450513 RepID=A0A951UE27_9CYAN|nr:hypothetical protein [Symplocastrum torsivum CPER-KK1]